MIIIAVKFEDWNGNTKTVNVTSDMCMTLHQCRRDIDMMTKAFAYIERRYTELVDLISIEIIAK